MFWYIWIEGFKNHQMTPWTGTCFEQLIFKFLDLTRTKYHLVIQNRSYGKSFPKCKPSTYSIKHSSKSRDIIQNHQTSIECETTRGCCTTHWNQSSHDTTCAYRGKAKQSALQIWQLLVWKSWLLVKWVLEKNGSNDHYLFTTWLQQDAALNTT